MAASMVAALLAGIAGVATLRPQEQDAAPQQQGHRRAPQLTTYVSRYEIVAEFPHDGSAFTQGLAFDPATGKLYESDGIYQHSGVREVDIETGSTVKLAKNSPTIFGEGLVVHNEKLVQLSWRENTVTEFQVGDLKKVRELKVDIGREGWGLATDGSIFYITDSGHELFHVEPETYRTLQRMPIVDERLGNRRIYGVNELEMVGGELWGNVYPMYQRKYSECVVRIDPASGKVVGWIDMHGLFAKQGAHVRSGPSHYVLNGIAFHAESGRIYVTGKNWDRMYEVRPVPAPELDEAHVQRVCNLG